MCGCAIIALFTLLLPAGSTLFRTSLLLLSASFLTAAAASAQSSLTTTFANNNGGATGWSNYFDLTIQVPVAITSLDVNINTAGAMGSIDIFISSPGVSHVGNEAGSIWTLAASSQVVTSNPTGTPTNCPLQSPLVLPPGQVAMAINYVGFGMSYTNGTGTNQMFSNSELTLVAGSSTASAPGVTGTLFTPRVWNGTINYAVSTSGGFGIATAVGEGCGGSAPESFFEQFGSASPFDLTNGFAILPSGNEELVISGFNPFVVPSGTPLAMADDQTLQVTLPFGFPIRGTVVTDLFLCSNGWVALESTTSTDFSESFVELFSGPRRVCAMWDDLNPAAGGTVHAEVDPTNPNTFHITFTDVPEFGGSGANTFQYSFDSSGIIDVKYGAASVADCLVGFSHGNGAASVPPTDLSDPALTISLGDGTPDLALRGGARPVLGTTATVVTDNIPGGAASGVLLMGFNGFNPGLDLSGLGAPGCRLFTSGQLSVMFPASGTMATSSFPIGNDMRLQGLNVHIQSAVLVPGINALNLILSNGLVWTIDQN